MSSLSEARADPVGAGLVALGVVLVALIVVTFVRPSIIKKPTRPLEKPPEAWAILPAHERLHVPGYAVSYWTNPMAQYGEDATDKAKPFVGIVTHYTRPGPVLNFVKYGHSRDFSRGGNSFGYHFYVDEFGRIAQGAPLSKRTNHMRKIGHRTRRSAGSHVDSSNSVGVVMTGACVLEDEESKKTRCISESLTEPQRRAGMAVIRALQDRFNVPCEAIWGHGELQTSRSSFEGEALAVAARCSPNDDEPDDVQSWRLGGDVTVLSPDRWSFLMRIITPVETK